MFKAQILGDRVSSNQQEAFSLYDKSNFGEKKLGKIEFSPLESLYLTDNKKMQIIQGKKQLGFEDLIKKIKRRDKRIELKFSVYSDLRKKGYVVKTALKFGADFRVYKKGVRPGQDHSLWIVHCVKESSSFDWQEFAAKNRVAHSARKSLLISIVDDEDSVTYYQVNWMKP